MTDTGNGEDFKLVTLVLCDDCMHVFFPNGTAITSTRPNGRCECPRCKKQWTQFPVVTSTFPPPSITICAPSVHRAQDELGYLFCHWCGRRLSEAGGIYCTCPGRPAKNYKVGSECNVCGLPRK